MNFTVFMGLFLGVSAFTGLVTQGVKKWLGEHGTAYRANSLAGYVAAALGVAAGAGYGIMTAAPVNAEFIACLAALVLLSWLCAMVGYDKVIQTVTQIRQSAGKE